MDMLPVSVSNINIDFASNAGANTCTSYVIRFVVVMFIECHLGDTCKLFFKN